MVMKLHHMQVLVLGLGVGMAIGLCLGLVMRGSSDAWFLGLLILALSFFGVPILGLIESDQASRRRLRDLNAESAAQRNALLWRVNAPASTKGYSRRRR